MTGLLPKISLTMRRFLTYNAKDEWTPCRFITQPDALLRRGLIETEWQDYQPPPQRTLMMRRTPLGRAVLNRNDQDG